MMARTNHHVCISVRGILNWNKTYTRRMLKTMTKSDGSRFTSVDEFRQSVMDELAKGHEVLPFGDPCEGFDYVKGCPGHPISDGE